MAERAGVSKSNWLCYYYYATMENLYLSMLRDLIDLRLVPPLKGALTRELRRRVDTKAEVIRGRSAAGRLTPVDPKSLLFLRWATTRHCADFAVQVEALTGETLANPVFFERVVANVQAVVLRGVAAG